MSQVDSFFGLHFWKRLTANLILKFYVQIQPFSNLTEKFWAYKIAWCGLLNNMFIGYGEKNFSPGKKLRCDI